MSRTDRSKVEHPLKPAELNVLLALAGGEMHGYGIRKDVEERSGGAVRLGPGTLYRTLDSLLERGWIVESGEVEEDGRHRRYYSATDLGMKAIAAEVRRLEGIVARAKKLGITGWSTGTGTVRDGA